MGIRDVYGRSGITMLILILSWLWILMYDIMTEEAIKFWYLPKVYFSDLKILSVFNILAFKNINITLLEK